MRFIRTEELKPGMRLARPIYNKSGVLLYERNTKLTTQGIYSVKNFGLIGIYILEPAEPLPPMTEEDIEFERFQTMSMFSLRNALKLIAGGKKTDSLKQLTREIVRRFGNMNHKVNFMQNLRSPEDDVYKLTAAIFDNAEAITKEHAKGAELSIENATQGLTVPFHAGAAKYFKEKGVEVAVK